MIYLICFLGAVVRLPFLGEDSRDARSPADPRGSPPHKHQIDGGNRLGKALDLVATNPHSDADHTC